jgi:hypothetical protein
LPFYFWALMMSNGGVEGKAGAAMRTAFSHRRGKEVPSLTREVLKTVALHRRGRGRNGAFEKCQSRNLLILKVRVTGPPSFDRGTPQL